MDPLTGMWLPVIVIAVVGDNLQQNENGTLSHPFLFFFFFFNWQLDSWQTVLGIETYTAVWNLQLSVLLLNPSVGLAKNFSTLEYACR